MTGRKLLKRFVPRRVSLRLRARAELRQALAAAAHDLEAVDQAISAANAQRGALRRAFRALQRAERALERGGRT